MDVGLGARAMARTLLAIPTWNSIALPASVVLPCIPGKPHPAATTNSDGHPFLAPHSAQPAQNPTPGETNLRYLLLLVKKRDRFSNDPFRMVRFPSWARLA